MSDMLLKLFEGNGDEWLRLYMQFRDEILRSFAGSGEYGMILTRRWAFDSETDCSDVRHVEELFASQGAEIYCVELEADYGVRLTRSRSENHLRHKPRERSVWHIDLMERTHRLNSLPGEVKKEHYLRIDNTHMEPDEAARRIKEAFGL